MKITKSQLREIIQEELIKEAQDIKQDARDLADDLVAKGILDKAYRTSTGSGAKGKNKIIGKSQKYSNSIELGKKIEDFYKKVGGTSLSSSVFSNGKLHFYFYGENDGFTFIVRRKNYKG